jgi:carbon storage regulator
MLIISRKKNESIVINQNILVTVVEFREDKVRLGIVSPKHVPVHRQEVYDAINDSIQTQMGNPPEYPRPNFPPLPTPVPDENSWRPNLEKSDPAIVESNERRAGFLSRLASAIKEKSGKDVSLGSVAQTLIDGIYFSGLDLSQAESLDQLKQLLVQSIKK